MAEKSDKPFRMAVSFNPETEIDRSAGLQPGTTLDFGLNIGAPGSRGKAPAAVAPRRWRDWRTPRRCAFSPRHRIGVRFRRSNLCFEPLSRGSRRESALTLLWIRWSGLTSAATRFMVRGEGTRRFHTAPGSICACPIPFQSGASPVPRQSPHSKTLRAGHPQGLGLRRPSAAFSRGSNFIIHPFHATTATGENTR